MNQIKSHLIDVQHVEVDPAELSDEGMSDSLAGSHVGLQDVTQLLNALRIFERLHVVCRVVYYPVPDLGVEQCCSTADRRRRQIVSN